MAAYASVISLKHTIKSLLNSSPIPLSPSTRDILEFAYCETQSLQKVLQRSNDKIRSGSSWERLVGLEEQIRDCANKLEDFLQLHEFDSEDEQVLVQETASFGERVNKMENKYVEELSRDDDNDDEDAASFWSSNDFGVEMVGHSDLYSTTRNDMLVKMRPDDTYVIAFPGGQGSGGTIIAKAIYEDISSRGFFQCGAWVALGRSPVLKHVLINIIAQLSYLTESECESLGMEEDEMLHDRIWKALFGRKYMIVLDDAYDDDEEWVDYLIKRSFPKQSLGSVVLITTNSDRVHRAATTHFQPWRGDLFRETMSILFHKWIYDTMPNYQPEFKALGEKILGNCRCSFILAVKAMLFLLKSEKTVELWRKIAADKENPIFMITDEISEIRSIQIELQHHSKKFVDPIIQCLASPFRVESVKNMMFPERFFIRMQIKSLFGMAGIGKTTFARKLFKDENICSYFNHCVWITSGPKYRTEDILIDILAQIYPDIGKSCMEGDEELVKELCVQLSCMRCLIVLDDLYSKEPLLYLKDLFPYIKGTALVTTRLAKVAKFERDDTAFEMKLLDKEESWCLLRQKVFGGGLGPLKLEKVGRMIAERCDGLPLMILTVAEQLLKDEISQERWNHVSLDKENLVFKNAHDQISGALLPSYHSIPQHLKPCFHYMGVFREKYEISTYDLTNLLIAEGFLEPNASGSEEDYVAECLSELVDMSLVMVQRKVSDSQIKTCRLSSVNWHLSKDQVMKNRFFHAMNRYDDCSIERMESQRRLCIQNGILLGFKDVQNSIANNTSTNTHTLLCASSFQQYPVPLYFDMRLLRVMNAVTIRLYEFPVEVVKLLHLRYLGITCNGELPTSISNLRKLQYLIVKRYLSIQSSENSSLLPVEIWDMKELRHLEITGGCLPDHKHGTTGLQKLSSLLDVSAESCREEVLKWIPNVKRLGIRIELEPDDDGKLFTYLNNIHHLHRLESLKCVVVNPEINSEAFSPPAPISMFPRSLKKLSLSGLGYSWEHMNIHYYKLYNTLRCIHYGCFINCSVCAFFFTKDYAYKKNRSVY